MSALIAALGGGGAIAAPWLNEGIQWLGRRETLIWTGVGILAVTLPVSFVIRAVRRTWAPVPTVTLEGSGRPRRRANRQSIRRYRGQIQVSRGDLNAHFMVHFRRPVHVGYLNRRDDGLVFPMMAERGLSEGTVTGCVPAMVFLGIPLRFIPSVSAGKICAHLIMAAGLASSRWVFGAFGSVPVYSACSTSRSVSPPWKASRPSIW